ncbi:hypothetical protein [Marivita sp.]|uniref:hypothetical protein n=1 Tax=Marivita sp. TaxID=2003365 RepID=UPI00261B5EE5|nr:hypothetical protein [Marivita sp.]
MIRAAVIAFLASVGPAAMAYEPGQSDYVFSSDLSAQGFAPFGTGGSGNTLYGMTNGSDIYLCFLFDTPEDQATRQTALLAELAGDAGDRTIPNIPVVCVMTQ